MAYKIARPTYVERTASETPNLTPANGGFIAWRVRQGKRASIEAKKQPMLAYG